MKLPSVADVWCVFLVCCKGDWRLTEVVLTARMQLTEIYVWIFLASTLFEVRGEVVEFLQYAGLL